jgi:YD repeat-containing protein
MLKVLLSLVFVPSRLRTNSPMGVLMLVLAVLAASGLSAGAQTTTAYHLHNEGSATLGLLQLKTSGPDVATVAIQWNDMKNQPAQDAFIRTYDTQPGVPSLGGVVPSGATVTFTLWMRKTAAFGTVFPRAQLRVSGGSAPLFCAANASTALTTTLQAFTFSCTTTAAIAMSTTDRLTVSAGFHMTAGPANHSMRVELDYEGMSPSTDSYVVAPNPVPPQINNVSPSSGPVNSAVTIGGTNFGATQGSSTVKFNDTTATPTSWSNTSISAPVPVGATTGPVVVTVSGAASNGATFTVIPPPILSSLAPASAHIGDAVTISGANFLATQGGSTVKFNGTTATPTSWSDTAIVAPVPSGTTTGNVVVTVSSQPSNGLAFTLIVPGSMSGAITRTTGGTPIAGATVQAVLTGIVKGSATSAADGSYSIPSLDPATYEVRVTATGFSSELRQGIAVTSSTATTLNITMSSPGALAGKITQADGTTPIAGAAVTAYSGAFQKGSTNTNATGDYSLSGLHAGAYTLQAANVGNRTKEQGVVVNEDSTTAANISLDAASSGPVLYAYDAIGRLIQVTDPSGDAAIYHYDPVGNITSIERPGASVVSISGFTPVSGAVGASVTIYGTGFSTSSANTITFGGGQVTATAATPNQLTVTVPAGAATSQLGLSNAAGSATSADTFTVTAAPTGAPTITSFTPAVGVAGTPVTITGTNFDPIAGNDRVTANLAFMSVSTATATSLTAPIPSAGSGPITVATPAGSAVTTTDLFIAPSPYTAAQVDFAQRMAIGGTKVVTIGSVNHIGLVTFSGTAGQRVSLLGTQGMSGFYFGCDVNVSLLTAYGTPIDFLPTCMESTGFMEVKTLRATGTYTILVVPTSPATGSVTLTLVDVPADPAGTITADGTPVTVTTTAAGQNARLTFSGAAGQRISLVGTQGMSGQVLACDVNVTILAPDGTALAGGSACMEGSGFIDPASLPAAGLPASGTYTIFVDPASSATGSLTLRLNTVTDFSGATNANGAAMTVPLTTAGQNGIVTFSGAASQWVSLTTSGIGGQLALACDVNASILRSGGSTLVSPTCVEGNGFIDALQLPASDTYTIFIDPASSVTGTLILKVYTATSATGSVTINGGSSPFSTVPGQNIDVTFSGAANQSVRGSTTANPSACATLKILRQDGTTVVSSYTGCGTTITMPATTLPAGETYHLIVDPSGAAAGTFGITVISP